MPDGFRCLKTAGLQEIRPVHNVPTVLKPTEAAVVLLKRLDEREEREGEQKADNLRRAGN